MITDLSVVEDPVRTRPASSSHDPRAGAWTFGRLMSAMAGTQDPSTFVRAWLSSWENPQTVNGFTVQPKSNGIHAIVLDPWLARSGGQKLDLDQAPFRLLAIVSRMDLRDLSQGIAGEGRFVFGVLDDSGNPLEFTTILEYKLLATTPEEVAAWARAWHDLGSIPLGDPRFNTALQAITDRFAGANADPNSPGGSGLHQLRTNEVALNCFCTDPRMCGPCAPSPWEMREFHLNPASGRLEQAMVAQTPDQSLNRSSTLASFINANANDIINQHYTVPASWNGQPMLGAAAVTDFNAFWAAPGVTNVAARHFFSLNTCNGCHGGETGTFFLQVSPRPAGHAATLSGFLLGEVVNDPAVMGVQWTMGDLSRRQADLANLLCGAAPADIGPLPGRIH